MLDSKELIKVPITDYGTIEGNAATLNLTSIAFEHAADMYTIKHCWALSAKCRRISDDIYNHLIYVGAYAPLNDTDITKEV